MRSVEQIENMKTTEEVMRGLRGGWLGRCGGVWCGDDVDETLKQCCLTLGFDRALFADFNFFV